MEPKVVDGRMLHVKMSGRLVGLQWLRAIAALLVVFAHVHNQLVVVGAQFYDGWIGGVGVDIFFVISGFIMFSVMDGDMGGRGSAWRFMARRFGRIVPPYWTLTVLILLGLLVVSRLTGGGLGRLASESLVWHAFGSFLFIDRNPIVSVGWTLCFEMLFYVLAAVSLWLFRSQLMRLLAIAVALLAFFVIRQQFAAAWFYPGEAVVFEFVAGGAIWWLLSRFGHRLAPVMGVAAIAAGVLGLAMLYGRRQFNHGDLAWLACASAIVLGGLIAEPWFRRVGWRWPVLLGDASYFLYLIHLYVVALLKYVMFGVAGVPANPVTGLLFLLLALGSVCLVAVIGFVYFEKPVTRRLTNVLLGRNRGAGD